MEDLFIRESDESETLAQLLKKPIGHIVDVIVLGSWLFTGRLVEVDDEEAVLCDVTVTACGGMTLNTFEVPKVVICLDDIISVGKPSSPPV